METVTSDGMRISYDDLGHGEPALIFLPGWCADRVVYQHLDCNSYSPLRALASLRPPVPVLHLCSQADDASFLAAQRAFAGSHPWFEMQVLKTHSHFPMFEAPGKIAATIEQLFVGSPQSSS